VARTTAAHLHEAPAGSEGPVRLGLRTPGDDGTAREECRRGLSSGFIRKIKRNPENYYVNVHNSEYPGGAGRGQLRFEDKPPEPNNKRDHIMGFAR